MVFNVGDTVQWHSSAAGGTTKKTGRILAVVEPGTTGAHAVTAFINKHVRAGTHRSAYGGGAGRAHTSYVVEVAVGSTKAKPVLYWPVASKLQLVPASC